MRIRHWFQKQLFYLTLTAGVLYLAAPITDTITLYAVQIMSGHVDSQNLGSKAKNLYWSLKNPNRSINKDIGPPVEVDIATLSSTRQAIITHAQGYLGTRYLWGGNTHQGIDCSGLVQQVYLQQDINLPRTAYRQFQAGIPIKRNELLPGDLIFFHTNYRKRGPTHVGIYVGNQHFMHAPKTGAVVKTTSINRRYYRQRFMGARRVVKES